MRNRIPKSLRSPLGVLFATWGIFFTVLFARMISLDPSEGLVVGHENVWSDWALHIGLATTFAEKSPSSWFAYHPMYADGKMTYTFLTNLISGLLMRVGLSLPLAFILPSIALSFALITGMYFLFVQLTGSGRKALAAVSLFFLSAGLGFIDYFREIGQHIIPARQFSRMDSYGWYSGNFIVGHLVPQRSMLLGMPLAIWAMVGFFHVLSGREKSPARSRRILLGSGLLAGLLPIAHMHSLIALLICMLPVVIVHWRQWKLMLYCIVPTGVISGLLYFTFISGGIEAKHFMTFLPGYTSHGLREWLWFWLRAWGLMIPIAILGSYWLWRQRARPEVLAFLVGPFLLFALANLICFQPITWDNSKLFAWAYLGFCLPAAEALAAAWERRRAWRAIAILSAMILTATGLLEDILVQRIDSHRYQILGNEELGLADRIRAETGELDRFLTAKDHNSLIMVRAARPILMGYVAWVWNFGFNYQPTESDMDVMFRGGEGALPLLKRHRISYVLIGPSEIYNYHPNVEFFRATFPIAFQTDRYKVFDVRAVMKP